jgi:hypothetical protein
MNNLLSIMEEFEVNNLSLNKIDTLRLHLAAITGLLAYIRVISLVSSSNGKVLTGIINVSNILLDSGTTHASYI